MSCCKSCTFCARAFPKERIKSRVSSLLYSQIHRRNHRLKYVKNVSCVTQLSCVASVINVQSVAQNLPVGARLQNFWKTWLDLGAGPKVIEILREGYTLPFRTRPKLTRYPTVISCYVNPHRSSYLLEALHQLIDKNAVELVQNQTSLGFFQPAIFGAKAQQQVEAYSRSEQTKSISQGGEIQNGDTGNHQNIPPAGGVGHLDRLQGRLLPYTNTGTIQEIPEISCRGSDIPVQSSAFWSVHSTPGVYCNSKGGELDGHTQGYKNPPVPRRLVCKSQFQPNLSPAYPNSGETVSRFGLVGEFIKIRAGTQRGLRFCRLPVRPQVRSSPTNTGPVAKPSRKDTLTAFTTGLSGLEVYVLDRFTDGHRKPGSPRPTAYETHTVASQKQLEGTRVSRKVIPIPRSLHPHLQRWLEESNVLQGQPLHPVRHALQIFTDASKEGWGAHLNEHTARGSWSLPESKLHINYLELKAVFLALKDFEDICSNKIVLIATDNTTVVSYINKEGGMRSGPLYALLWRILTWCTTHQVTLKARHIPGRLNVVADKLSRLGKTIQTEWALLPEVFQTICSRWHWPQIDLFATRFNNKLPLFVSPVPDPLATAVDALSLQWEDLDAYAFPPTAMLGKVVEKLQGTPCKRIILIAPGWPNMPWFWDLVTMSSQIPLSLPNLPNLLTQPFNQIPHRNLINLNLHAWLLEPQQSRRKVSLR